MCSTRAVWPVSSAACAAQQRHIHGEFADMQQVDGLVLSTKAL
jgi:hypothetical protein